MPILHLQGAQDGAILPAYVEGLESLLPPGSRVQEFPDAGHFLQIEQPEKAAAAVLEYLGSR